MDKNKLCRQVLDIKEVLEVKISENIVTLENLSIQEKKDIIRKLHENVESKFNIIVDKILES